ncbi:hypothetical protein FQR65_LT11519 [Abscondita terminalis]|nr:hypothetical protein FQR65_LT11519 [Abscondita terminalis]
MENTSRYFRGKGLLGARDSFNSHLNSITYLYLDNENSFMSGSRDKTVKLWSLRFVLLRWDAPSSGIVYIGDPYLGVNIGHLESPKVSSR